MERYNNLMCVCVPPLFKELMEVGVTGIYLTDTHRLQHGIHCQRNKQFYFNFPSFKTQNSKIIH